MFIGDYLRYLAALRVREAARDWGRRLGEEVLRSPLNQVTLILGVIGVTGTATVLLGFLLRNPLVLALAVGSGLVMSVGLSMYSFYVARRTSISVSQDHGADQDERLLKHLLKEHKLTRQSVMTFLRADARMVDTILLRLANQGWIEQASGVWKIRAAMVPILRSRLREKAR